MIITAESKSCTICKEVKTLNNFSYRNDRKNYINQCKSCRNSIQRDYQKSENGKRVQYLADQKRNEKFKKNRHARTIVYRAIKNKTLTPLPCLICGDKSEAHHPDYDLPLDVVWLCRKHHKETHLLTKELENAY